jgi:hypothetical protein
VRTCLGRWAVALTLIALPACSTAESGASRANCRPADDFTPSLADTAAIFEAISPDYIDRAFPHREERPLPLDRHEVEINALNAPTIVLVLTSQHRLAKLLAQRDGKDLLIRKSVSYPLEAARTRDWKGQPDPKENIRVTEGNSVNLDPSGGDSLAAKDDIRWQSDDGRPPTLVIRPAASGFETYWTQIRSLIVVPVVAHRMKSRQHADDVKQAFSNAPSAAHRPEVLFNLANDTLEKSVNAVWAPAGILFYLHRLEDCEYSLDDFPVQPPPATAPPATTRDEVTPWPMADCQTRFRHINSTYNDPDVKGLDAYLWARLEGDVLGYAGRHKSDWPSPGPGAVWIDRKCAGGGAIERSCERVLAHEIGHFLRLCHICVTKTTPPEDRGRCGFCAVGTPECSKEHLSLLMRDDQKAADDPKDVRKIPILTLSEIKEARKEAWQRVSGK